MHVTFATDNAYAPLTAVAMYSVCDVVPEVNVTVLADDLDDTARANLARTLENHPGARLDIVDVSDLVEPLDLPIDHRFNRPHTRTVWASLLLGSVLPGDLQRTLYLDSDVIVRRNPSTLWDLDLDGNVVAAVLDGLGYPLGGYGGIAYHRELGLAPELEYFNSGVLLVDLGAWRRDDVTLQCQEILRKYHHHVIQWDQEILNAALAGRWLPLDRRWNCMTWWLPDEECQPPYEDDVEHAVIRHFAGRRDKPWNHDRPVPHRDEFDRLASGTGVTDGRSWIQPI